ncbi:PAAR domain-containing protein [Aquimarina sp. I32.4]|uniref:PAAR domain-containing protein n=1 Tax=Aquimarina sp. I32.4 TaxID=2053903 RepID=UPI000CDEDE1D|nr:PAAR domain-containing protein [Aquimarina sp. I32.4]
MSSKPAATISSMHTCPMCSGSTPHIGGPITTGEANIMHNNKPAATVESQCICAIGGPDTIVQGHPAIFHNGKPAAMVGHMTAHGGIITTGEANITHGFVTEPMEPYTMSTAKIPFPQIGITNRLLGNTTEAQANQQALQQQAENTEGEPKVYNYQWRKERTVIRDRKVLKIVTLTADVIHIPDGGNATIKVLIPANDESQETQVVELTGVVKDKQVTVEWELEDASANENSNS